MKKKKYQLLEDDAIIRDGRMLKDDVHVGENANVQGDPKRCLSIEGTTMIMGNTVMEGYGPFPEKEAILEAGSFRIEASA